MRWGGCSILLLLGRGVLLATIALRVEGRTGDETQTRPNSHGRSDASADGGRLAVSGGGSDSTLPESPPGFSQLLRSSSHRVNRLDLPSSKASDNFLSSFSVKYMSCSRNQRKYVPANSNNHTDAVGDDAENGQSSAPATMLVSQQHVLFRLCPNDDNANVSVSSLPRPCSVCNSNYGEYIIDLKSYAMITSTYFQHHQQQYCETCYGLCLSIANDDGGRRRLEEYANGVIDCSTCVDECDKIVDMEPNGYYDATNFLACQIIYDPSNDTRIPLYAGPICSDMGAKIKIGVFLDRNCLILDASKQVDDYLVNDDGSQMKLSHALLSRSYTDTCISCLGENTNNATETSNNVEATCSSLYNRAGKCETSLQHFPGTVDNSTCHWRNSVQESYVCDYIQSLKTWTVEPPTA